MTPSPGGAGNDSMLGGTGDDSLIGEAGSDTLRGGDGNDSMQSGVDADLVFGDGGNDTINSDIGNDTVYGGDGQDNINGLGGNDVIYGDDVSTTAGANDTITGGIGDDTIYGGGGADSIDGDISGDTIAGGADSIDGGSGGDTINGGVGNDMLAGGADNDSVTGGAGNDTIRGDAGNDTLTGDAGADSIAGGAGTDQLVGGSGADTLDGGAGVDQLVGGSGADVITAGLGDDAIGEDDRDRFTLSAADGGSGTFNINGGTGSTAGGDVDDYDSIIVGPGLTFVGGSMDRTVDVDTGSPHTSYSGTFKVSDGTNIYTVNFTEIESVPICFVRGSLIETMTGPVPVEALRAGDMIRTRDNGYRPISWIGSRQFQNDGGALMQKIGPIAVRAGALGQGLPARDLFLSPQHRVLVRSRIVQRMFGADEVLVAVKHLLGLPGVETIADFDEVEYFHFLFDQHEIVYANGLEAESLHTGPQALVSLDPAALDEIFTIFPELANPASNTRQQMARPVPKGKLVRQLAHRHVKNGVPLQ